MRICILTEYLTYIGGGERVYCNWANMFADELGHDVTISSFEDAQSTFYKISDKVKIESLHLRKEKYYQNKIRRKLQMIIYAHSDICALAKYFEQHNFDIIIGIATNISLLLALTRINNSIKIGTEHTEYDGAAFYLRWLRKSIYPKLNILTVLTQADKNRFDKFMPNVVVMPNPLSITVSSTSTLENNKIVSIGSLSPQKDQLTMLDIFKKVQEKHPEWILEIYGEGIMRKQLEYKIQELELTNHVFLRGTIQDVSQVLSTSSIFILTSKIEGFGLVLIEAMACGVPCISFDNPGPSDIIDNGKNGFLIKNRNIDLFVAKIIESIEDISLRKKMGVQAKLCLERFNPQKIKKQWELILQQHISKSLHTNTIK